MNNGSIPEKAKADFDRDGFVVIRGFFDAAQAQAIEDEIDRYITHVAPNVPPAFVMYDDIAQPDTLKQLAHIAEFR